MIDPPAFTLTRTFSGRAMNDDSRDCHCRRARRGIAWARLVGELCRLDHSSSCRREASVVLQVDELLAI